ncbi:MAG: flagellar export chaperone FlgN [Deltaproteobacteria bacterium]|nr:flagellar export chaperone FlgN [Deltaproteobacteria bacterium]MBW2015441.1 flagellar export chaperone FlgN [Deltaproteobacteria bacterium]MBW2129195.1 flagellar export chaperone FlgN [Deltaproteobacteria bacterium]MBW2302809.1 flagellar export chaperone FlgN [Deltaproteobacteria bacterium]
MESLQHDGDIQDLYRKKASLLQGLLQCLEQERDHLIHLNVPKLWELLEEKQELIRAIEELRTRILSLEGDESRGRGRARAPFPLLARKIARLKEEIAARAKENVTFIRDTLVFFDELISILLSGGNEEPAYRRAVKGPSDSTSAIYHMEV